MGLQTLLGVLVTIFGGVITLILLLFWLYPWLKLDLQTIFPLAKALLRYKGNVKNKRLIIDEFEEKVKKHPKKVFLIFEGKEYTYEFMNEQMNKVAHAALKMGLRKGTNIAMMMNNEPAFIWTYLGLAKIGVQMAFLNFNLRSKSLLHCFTASSSKILIVGKHQELINAVEEIYPDLKNNNVLIYVWGVQEKMHKDFKSMETLFQEAATSPISKLHRDGIKFFDPLCYIYTSGTTGLPKAAIISHSRAIKASLLMPLKGVNEDDILYTPLPLYHSAAGLMALGTTIMQGATLVLRNKFSATHFFEDCAKYNVTVIQYIGELCRYLLARPPSPSDKAHNVKLAMGNGLRRDIWNEFVTRFRIPIVVEFYAATEGNSGFINLLNKSGCVGRCSPLMRKLVPTFFVKYDFETGEPVRNADGFCEFSSTDEAGLMIAPIQKDLEFEGYKGQKDLSEKKVLRNVFKKGDIFYNSGDLFILDKDYFVYFADRIGDTFRWKGENVATIEVSNVISELKWIEDANVYGVEVPGQDGRAGMAAICLAKNHKLTSENLSETFQHCKQTLPAYAIPRFLRFQSEMEITSTFKQRKVELVKEGFDPAKTKSSDVYCVDFTKNTYKPVTAELYKAILAGKERL